jgi:uncharacterized membrane protein YkgB
MKSKYSLIALVLCLTLVAAFSCKEDERYATKQVAASQMQFQVADPLLTGSAFFGVVQPSYDVTGARFSKTSTSPNYAGGNVVVTVNASSNVTGIVVNVLAANGTREQRAALTGSGTFTFTYPIATLGLGNTTPANNAIVMLEFIATGSDGSTTVRVFAATVIA